MIIQNRFRASAFTGLRTGSAAPAVSLQRFLPLMRVAALLSVAVLVSLGCKEKVDPMPTGSADTTPPSVTLSSSAPVLQGKTNANPVPIAVTFSEPVTGFSLAAVTVANGTAGNLTGAGADYAFDVTPSGSPVTVTVDVPAGGVTDAAGNANVAALSFSIAYDATFNPLDLPPTVSDITDKSTNQDVPLQYVLFSADEGAGEDAQVLSVVSLTSSDQTLIPDANIVLTAFTDNGALPGAEGELTVTPAAGQTGTATITVTVTDGNSVASDTFLVTVNAVVDPPVAFNVNAVTAQNVAVGVTLAASDPGGDAIVSWNLDIAPRFGSLSGTAPNLVYTPDPGFSGRDAFTFSVTDATGESSNAAIVTLIVDGSADFIVADPTAVMTATGAYPGDEAVYAEIQALGFNVTLVDDNAVLSGTYGPTEAGLVDLVIISSSTASANVGSTFQSTPTPVMTWERFLYDAASGFGMTGTTDVDDGIVNTTQIRIVNSAHPLAGGLANGTYTVFTAPQDLVWGEVAAPGEVVAEAEVTVGVWKPVLFTYSAGDLMQGGVVAPAKRVAYFLPDAGLGGLTADGITLLHASINEALAR